MLHPGQGCLSDIVKLLKSWTITDGSHILADMKLLAERFENFMRVAATLSLDEFLEQFPHPFLFYSKKPGVLEDLVHTRLVEPDLKQSDIDRFTKQALEFLPLLPNPKPNPSFPHKAFIGRSLERDFVIEHNTVSNRHACLQYDPDSESYFLLDSGSTNGTKVRGRTLTPGEPVQVRDGDVLVFGRMSFLFFTPKGAYRYLHQYRLFRHELNK